MSVGANPLIDQGMLNRVLTNVVVTLLPQLSVTSPYMAKSQAQITFDDDFVDQIGSATGVVNSPAPYIMGSLVINLLRSQAVSGLWIAQSQVQSVIGPVIAYPDSTAFPPVALANCSIKHIDPGAYDGQDPTVKVTVRGVFYTNAALWLGA